MTTACWTRQPTCDDPSVVETVVGAIAEELDAEPVELDPIYDAVDPDALAEIFADCGGTSRNAGTVTFESNGCSVTVFATGEVSVSKLGDSADG